MTARRCATCATTTATTPSSRRSRPREARGEKLDNRLIRIDSAKITAVDVGRTEARITVRYQADISAITRDADGKLIAGSSERRRRMTICGASAGRSAAATPTGCSTKSKLPECAISGHDDLIIRIVAQDQEDLYRVAGILLEVGGIQRTRDRILHPRDGAVPDGAADRAPLGGEAQLARPLLAQAAARNSLGATPRCCTKSRRRCLGISVAARGRDVVHVEVGRAQEQLGVSEPQLLLVPQGRDPRRGHEGLAQGARRQMHGRRRGR